MKNELTEFNAGGSHAQNPLGGVPQGVNPNGKTNTVEEGETKIKVNNVSYVFSNRLSMKSTYLSKYYLPNYIKNKTFSEASKAIESRFKDRTDNASMSTKDSMFKRLAESQEFAKLEKEADDNGISVEKLLELKQEQQAALEQQAAEQQAGQQPQGKEQGQIQEQPRQENQEGQLQQQQEQPQTADSIPFDKGGSLDIGSESTSSAGVGAAIGGAGALLSMGLNNAQATEKVSVEGATAKAALTGAAAGAALGPIGAAGGALIGGAVGLFSAKKGNKRAHNANMDNAVQANTGLGLTTEGRAYGGMMPTDDNSYGGPIDNNPPKIKAGDPLSYAGQFLYNLFNKKDVEKGGFSGGFGGAGYSGAGTGGTYPKEEVKKIQNNKEGINITGINDYINPSKPSVVDYTKATVSNIPAAQIGYDTTSTIDTTMVDNTNSNIDMNNSSKTNNKNTNNFPYLAAGAVGAGLAPFIGNLVEGANLTAPEKNILAKAGRTYIPEFADERQLLNTVNDSYSGLGTALAGGSGGDLGAYRANMLGASINKSKASFEAYNQINEINRQERKNLNTDFATATREGIDKYNIQEDLDKQDRAAYNTAKGAYRTAAYEGLGELGKTIFTLNQADGLSTYEFLTGKKRKINNEPS